MMSHRGTLRSTGAHPTRRDAGQMRWTERDLTVLPWIGEQYAARFDQLQVLLSRQPLGVTKEAGQVAASTVRARVARWKEAGLVQTVSLVQGEPGWVWLTREGLCQVGLAYPLWQVSLSSHLDHLFACNAARLWVEAHEPEAAWRSERALRSEQAWMHAGIRLGHRPSAEVVRERDTVAIEVAGVLEQAQRVREALPDLLARYPGGCWYFVAPRARSRLERLLVELGPPVQARVRLIDLTEERGSVFAGHHRQRPSPALHWMLPAGSASHDPSHYRSSDPALPDGGEHHGRRQCAPGPAPVDCARRQPAIAPAPRSLHLFASLLS